MKSKRTVLLYAIILLGMSVFCSLCFGAVRLNAQDLLQAVLHGPSGTAGYIFWYARFPRTCACLLAGCALSVSGCILQKVLGNSLASPNIIGVNAGAGLAVTICCAFGMVSGWIIAFCSFAGAMLAGLLIFLIARKTGGRGAMVILAGAAMNSILNSMRDSITSLVPNALAMSTEFRVGGFSAVVTSRLIPAGILILLCLLPLFCLLNELDVLSLGDDMAESLGLPAGKLRILFLLIASLLAGCAVSFAGLLGFAGLLIPHIARRIAGNESRYLLPFSALLGASFVTFCDLIARMIFAPHELYTGILMSLIGGPFFLYLLLRRKEESQDA